MITYIFSNFSEFLSGFSKRKTERKRKAKTALEKKIKNELKRIRQETKDGIKKNCKSFEPIKFPALGNSDLEEDVIEDDSVTVSVKTLGVDDLAQKNNWIGSNKGFVVESESEVEDQNGTEEIQGMGLSEKKEKKPTKEEEPAKKYQSKKDIDREMKKKTLKAIKKSKTFQAKGREKRSKDRQVSRRIKHFKQKTKTQSKKSFKKHTKK